MSATYRLLLRTCCLACFIAFSGAVPLCGQQPDDSDSAVTYWLYAGPGLTSLGTGGSAGLGIEFSGNVLSMRATSTALDLGSETWDIALLYGRVVRHEDFLFSAGAGVAVVGGMRYGGLFGAGTAEEMDTQMGFPLGGTALWVPAGVVGIGLHGYANVNTGHPFGGLGVVLRVGKLR